MLVHRVSIWSPQSVHLECPPSPSRVLRRARRFLLLQVTCASSVGLPGLRGGVRACGSFLIKLIAPKTETETRSVPTQGWRVISFRRETTPDILSFIALQLDMTSDYLVEKLIFFEIDQGHNIYSRASLQFQRSPNANAKCSFWHLAQLNVRRGAGCCWLKVQ